MKRFFALCVFASIFFVRLVHAESFITPEDAKNHIGEMASVCGIVASTKYAFLSPSTSTFLNLNQPYPNQIFTVFIWGADRSKFTPPPEGLKGSNICVRGIIKDYKGKPEIIATDPSQIRKNDSASPLL